MKHILRPVNLPFINQLATISRIVVSRKLKRLINVYTIIRDTLQASELQCLVEPAEGRASYPALLVDLFIILSAPDVSSRYLVALARHNEFEELMAAVSSGSVLDHEMIAALKLYRISDYRASIDSLKYWSLRVRNYGWLNPYALEESVRAYL
jgi:hypothetical protein